MVRITVLLTVLFLSVHCFSQQSLFVMHPLLGDTIDKTEKMKYFLLRQINDSDFKSCTITHSKDGYVANTRTIHDSVFITPIDSAEIRQTIAKLDNVMEYYANQEKKDSTKSDVKATQGLVERQPGYSNEWIIDQDTRDRIVKETRRDGRLKYDAERQKQVRQGTDITGGGYIEVFRSGRKKRK